MKISSKFDNHKSIKKIKEYFPDASKINYQFTEVSQDEVKKEVLHLSVKKVINKQLYSSNNSETIH